MLDFKEACRVAAQGQHPPPTWAGADYRPPPDLPDITQRAIDMYMLSKQDNGEMGGIGWWQAPNGYTALARHDLWSGSRKTTNSVADAVRRCESNHPGFVNEFNDDTLWWGICCTDCYTVTGDPWFLHKAQEMWKYMRHKHVTCRRGEVNFNGRDMEGACYWTTRPGEEAINSITTGLFAELSVRLALLTKDNNNNTSPKERHGLNKFLHHFKDDDPAHDDYIEAARCSLGWILRCRWDPDDGIVRDGFMLHKREEVDWTFTYNTGVALGVCALLYEALRQPEYLDLAIYIAHKAMRKTSWVESHNGVLTEPEAYGYGRHSALDNGDGVGFKAVLMRHLATLYDVITRTNAQGQKAHDVLVLIRTFVNVNFQSQQERNTNGNAQYGPWWNGPWDTPTSHSQMAVMDIMAAVRLVNR